MKRILTAGLTAALLLSLLVVPAAAHGGHHGRSGTATVYCDVCDEYHTRGACPDGYTGGGHHGGGRCH